VCHLILSPDSRDLGGGGAVGAAQLKRLAQPLAKSGYGEYLLQLLETEYRA